MVVGRRDSAPMRPTMLLVLAPPPPAALPDMPAAPTAGKVAGWTLTRANQHHV